MPSPAGFTQLLLGNGFSHLKGSFLLADLLRFTRNPSEQKDFWKDIRRSWGEWEDIRAKIAGHESSLKAAAPHALVFSLTNWPYQIKMEAQLALGLVMQGWKVSFLVRGASDRWALRYLAALGFSRFVFWDNYTLDDNDQTEVEKNIGTFANRCQGFREVKEWNYRGCWIGPQLLASVSRGIMEGSPDPSNPVVKKALLKLLPKTLQTVVLAEKLLEDIRPQLALITEPNYAVRGALTDTAIKMGINMIQFCAAPRDDALILQRLTVETRREHPISLAPQTMARVAAEPWTDQKEEELSAIFNKRYDGSWFLQGRNQQNTKGFSREAAIEHMGLDPSRKTAVVFSHVLWDANLFYGKDLFEDYGDWFVETVKAACNNPRLNWVIKLHPANLWKRQQQKVEGEYTEFTLLRRHLGDLKNLPAHVHFLLPDTPINTPSLFNLLDLGITVRGTVSAELPCWGKPILTAGTGRCYGHGFTIDSSTREEYLDRLAHAETIQPLSAETILLARKHAHALFLRRPWIMESFTANYEDESQGRKTLGQNFYPVRGASYTDLHKWAQWATGSGQVDYLEP